MPAPNISLQYLGVDKPILPFRSNTSIVDESLHWAQGSSNIRSTISGWTEKRPGFTSAVESVLSQVPGTIVRGFVWRRWASSFYVMICTIVGTTSRVYKLEVGVDPSFVLLYTDTTSVRPFDFVVSDNFCFFGNATVRVNMRKFDGGHVSLQVPTGCSLWGVDAPSAPPSLALSSGDLPAGLTFNVATGVLSGTPTVPGTSTITILSTDSLGVVGSATYSLFIDDDELSWVTAPGALSPAINGSPYTSGVAVNGGTGPYVYSLLSGTLPTGLTLNPATGAITGTATSLMNSAFAIKAVDSLAATVTRGFSIFVSSSALTLDPTLAGGTQGIAYTDTIATTGGTAPYVYSIVGGAIPAGLTFTSAGVLAGNPTGYGYFTLTVKSTDAAGLQAEMVYPLTIISASVQIMAGPTSAKIGQAYSFTFVSAGGTAPYTYTYTAGAISAQTGYVYGQTFTSIYGHESAMSELSGNTGLFTDQDVAVDVIASGDPQVSGINLYRTPDGGALDPSTMRLLVSLTNLNQTYTDATIDNDLGTQTGPALYINDVPQPLDGFTWSNGRIWGRDGGSKTWFTGNEEVTNGIAEECMSDAINGNFYAWPAEVGGMTTTPEGVDIGLSEQYWQITGDTLDSFRKSILLTGGGTLSPINIIAVGSTVFWIDTAKQVFSSDAGEIGEPIRPDLANIIADQTYIVYYKSKTFNLLCILDAANGKLLTYDFDLSQWNAPWLVPGMTCLFSGEVTRGNLQLIGTYATGEVRMLTPDSYLDNGVTYGEQMRSNLIAIVPGRGTSARQSTSVRQPVQWEMEVSMIAGDNYTFVPRIPDLFYCLVDDDPVETDLPYWFDISTPQDPQDALLPYENRDLQKRYLAARRWIAQNGVPPGRRVSFAAVWNASPLAWKQYSWDLAWQGA